jgi:serine/threonine-protein kinase RsbW
MRPEAPFFQCHLRATPDAVRGALAALVRSLDPLDLTDEECGSVELVMAEAMNNVAQHAYAGTEAGEMSVEICLSPDGLHCRLRDSGIVMPDGRLPFGPGASATIRPSALPEGGFGWFLIRSLARDLRYTRRGKDNLLEFRIAVRPCRTTA